MALAIDATRVGLRADASLSVTFRFSSSRTACGRFRIAGLSALRPGIKRAAQVAGSKDGT